MVDTTDEGPLGDLFDYPLLEAIYGRRARRFGMGMEIPSGPLAFRSSAEPAPLTEFEHAVLVAAGAGVTGWNFGVPFGPDRPNSHAHYTQRFTGRTAPTAAGHCYVFMTSAPIWLPQVRAPVTRELAAASDDPARFAGA